MRMTKKTAVKEDGRLIVYYSFPKDTAKSKEAEKKSERN